MAEFAISNSKNSSTNENPFYLNYGHHLKSPLALGVEIRKPIKGYDNLNACGLVVAISKAQHPILGQNAKPLYGEYASSDTFCSTYSIGLKWARECLKRAQNRVSKHANHHKWMLLLIEQMKSFSQQRTFTLEHPGTHKLLPRWIGPFTIFSRVGNLAYCLKLLESMHRTHLVFHTSKLQSCKASG